VRALVAFVRLLGAAAVVAAALWSAPVAPPKVVRPFLIFYGSYPGRGGRAFAARVARQFSGYAMVVFGDALGEPALARLVHADMPGVPFYGYVDTGKVTMAQVDAGLAGLHRLGFEGVLLDDVGDGLSSRTAPLQAIVDRAHRDGLAVLLNAWDPASVVPLRLEPGRDAILCENWVYADGAWHVPRVDAVWRNLHTLEARGVRVYMIVTGRSAPVVPASVVQPVRQTVWRDYGQYVSVSGPNYSSTTNAVFPARSLDRILAGISY